VDCEKDNKLLWSIKRVDFGDKLKDNVVIEVELFRINQ
jgi:hypothetical protein